MTIAIISDIHGNLEAFEKVLADIDNEKVDSIICLGDCIGYGPQPEEVIKLVRERNIPTLMGNHELAVRDKAHLSWFNPRARRSLEITISMLSPSSLVFIQNLPTSKVIKGNRYVHGFPPDSVRTYLFQKTESDLAAVFDQMAEHVCFVGHTHDLEIIEFEGSTISRRSLFPGHVLLAPDHRYIINIGSVGQPRDGTNEAKYVLWHPDENHLEIRSLSYDISTVVEKIKAAGLPEENAKRLW